MKEDSGWIFVAKTKGSIEPPVTRKNSPQAASRNRDLGKTSLAEQKEG